MGKHVARLGAAGLAAMLLAPVVHAQQPPAADQERSSELATLKAELAAQRALVDKLMRELQAQQSKIERIEEKRDGTGPALADLALPPRADELLLSEQRGTGGQNGTVPTNVPAPANNRPPPTPVPAQPAPRTAATQAPAQPQQNTAQNTATRNERDQRPPEVAPLFEAPGVLTPRGKVIFEPSLQFGYSSSNRVALVGYTVIPALLIGLVDVREIKRNTFTGALTARTGLNNRMEVEVKLPYVYRSDATVSREIFTGTAAERVFDTSGKGIGDVEIAGRYQLNDGGPDKPYYIGGLRYKSRTGRDPFEVVTDCQTRCVGENVTGTGLPLSLPTGSGFHSLQGSLTWLFPSDPAVFFGNISYLHNFKRSNVERLVRNGIREPLGELEPGSIIGFNFGMGLALNDKASLSLGYDHNTVARLRQNGRPVPGAVRTQLGTLLLGYSYRFNEKRSLSVAVGAGVTRDTPDVSLTVRMPFTF
ncbi:PspA/IM30 family protein [Massilia consociata]|uniref:PspA/IM30 family protein n=1 Tax=Massilia consociata TaxID=760117 RepID=A0ABV6FJR6_9BURK